MIPRSALVVLPALVLAASLGLVLIDLGPEVLVHGVAHESEPRSLLATALYPSHALRELPHLVVLACVWIGTSMPTRSARDFGRQTAAIAGTTLVFGGLLFSLAAYQTSLLEAWTDLLQRRGASDLVGAGAHYRLHAVSDPILALLFAGAAGLFPRSGRSPVAALGGALFFAMTAVWINDGAFEPRALGHGIREVITHASITLPLLLALAVGSDSPVDCRLLWTRRWPAAWLVIAAALTLAAAIAAGPADVMAHSSAPERPIALSIAVHNFEHLLDLLFLTIVSVAARAWGSSRLP